ncbi:MAG: hypothetical protein KGK44_11385 [Gammaproteobacteria bacterium]|nr:hypothetical protein [Gammaproteobacteria bacterium]
MDMITVHRKAYTRRDGTRVRAATYQTLDKGKPGRTPKSARFFSPGVKMGWRKDQAAAIRRREALKAHKGNLTATGRALQEIANVTTDARTAKLAKADADYFFMQLKLRRH